MISIILPTYNRCNVIRRAIDSVLQQTYSEFELIIIDDGSTDDTLEILSRYKDNRIKVFNLNRNRGANYARNYGIKKAIGEWIAFIDSDNEWREDKLAVQLKCVKEDDRIALVFSAFERIENNFVVYYPQREHKVSEFTRDELADKMILDNYIDTNTVLVKKECFEKVGLFDEELLRIQDWEMFYRIIELGGFDFKFIDQALDKNYLQQDSLSCCNSNWINGRLSFLKKYIDIIVKHKKEKEFISDLLLYPCDDISLERRVDLINDVIGNKNIEYTQALIMALLKSQDNNRKFRSYYQTLHKWMQLKLNKRSLSEYFIKNKYLKIAIYGAGNLGQQFKQELKDTEIEIVCMIDRATRRELENIENIPAYSIEELECLEADCVVITVVNEFEEIKRQLRHVDSNINIISLSDVMEMI